MLSTLSGLDDLGITFWLDGGWGVDALLGEQTRPHGDLDLVVVRPELGLVLDHLRALGFDVVRDWLPTSIALRDALGREVDLHPVDPTSDGGGDQRLPDGGTWRYGPPVVGTVAGRRVRCASAEEQLAMHQGYEPRAVDKDDVRRLADRFGLPLPPPYGRPRPETS